MDLKQGTPAWFQARKGKLTASNFGAAAGVNPYSSRAKTLRQALDVEAFSGPLEACMWGTRNETNAIKDYMVRTGNVVIPTGFYTHPHYSWLGGSPDGLVGDKGIVEVKCPWAHMVPHAKIPPHYFCQVNGLLEILDRDWCDFITWTPTAFKIYRVWRDRECFNYLLDRYAIFFAYMKRGCTNIPKMAAGERQAVLDRIAEADERTTYHFWSYLEPPVSAWESPPDDPFSDDSVDGTAAVWDLPGIWSPPDNKRSRSGDLHGDADGVCLLPERKVDG